MSKNGTVKPINWVWVATNVSENIKSSVGSKANFFIEERVSFTSSGEQNH